MSGSTKQMRPLRREMQVVFQDPFGSLSPRMSIAEIVGEGPADPCSPNFPMRSATERVPRR
jgi:microcin C transport system ATP-binding protein